MALNEGGYGGGLGCSEFRFEIGVRNVQHFRIAILSYKKDYFPFSMRFVDGRIVFEEKANLSMMLVDPGLAEGRHYASQIV
jgi:hypothetical protein